MNEIEKKEMKNIPYALAVVNLMYAQVCTRSDIAYVVGKLSRYLSNLGMVYQKAAKWVMMYLQRTKDFLFTYQRYDH